MVFQSFSILHQALSKRVSGWKSQPQCLGECMSCSAPTQPVSPPLSASWCCVLQNQPTAHNFCTRGHVDLQVQGHSASYSIQSPLSTVAGFQFICYPSKSPPKAPRVWFASLCFAAWRHRLLPDPAPSWRVIVGKPLSSQVGKKFASGNGGNWGIIGAIRGNPLPLARMSTRSTARLGRQGHNLQEKKRQRTVETKEWNLGEKQEDSD